MARTALIIGASRGIGREFVRQLCADGWKVFATARDDASLAMLADEGAHAIKIDVTKPESLAELAGELGLGDVVRFVPPVAQAELARWYAAATLVAVPSYSESFGLVAAEAGACGTPVVAAAVGGLPTVVRHERSGLLVDSHDDADWAQALGRVLTEPGLHDRLAAGAALQARQFSWDATAGAMLRIYERARWQLRAEASA